MLSFGGFTDCTVHDEEDRPPVSLSFGHVCVAFGNSLTPLVCYIMRLRGSFSVFEFRDRFAVSASGKSPRPQTKKNCFLRLLQRHNIGFIYTAALLNCLRLFCLVTRLSTYTVEWTESKNGYFEIDLYYCGSMCTEVRILYTPNAMNMK